MKSPKGLTLLSLFIVIGIIGATLQASFSTDEYTRIFCLETGGSKYDLTLTVSELLYNSYKAKGHPSTADKFVTPQAFTQVASQIRSVFVGDEDFANAVLMLMHQFTYSAPCDLKYPVETVVDKRGDCDVFSVLAASVMNAGRLDVVLLKYPDHMNLGVYLQHEPSGSRTSTITWYTYDGKRYYVAETTGGLRVGSVLTPWRVGEDSGEYKEATVVSLVNCDTSLHGQVTATLTRVAVPPPPTSSLNIPPIVYGLLLSAGGAAVGWLLLSHVRVSGRRQQTPDAELPDDAWCICPNCGAYISANIEYCQCGTKLPKRRIRSRLTWKVEQKPLKNQHVSTPVTEKLPDGVWCICPKCGAYISANIEYCHCGTKLPKRPKNRG